MVFKQITTLLLLTVLFQFSRALETSGYNNEEYNYDYYDTAIETPAEKLKQKSLTGHDDVLIVTSTTTSAYKKADLDDYYDYGKYDDYYADDKSEYKPDNYKLPQTNDLSNTHVFIDNEQMKQVTEPEALIPVTDTPQPAVSTRRSARDKLLTIISKPGILAGIVGGAIIGVLTAILLIMFIVYRMKKKDEGSYALEETKKPLNAYDYRNCPTKEFYA